MNASLYSWLKLGHVLAMAIWVGGSIVAPIGVRRALAAGQPHVQLVVPRLQAATWVMIGAAWATVSTGALLVAAAGGLGHVPPRILWGAALTPLIFVLGGGITRPTLNRMHDHFLGGGDASSAEPLVRRFFYVINLELALRLVVLALMVLPI